MSSNAKPATVIISLLFTMLLLFSFNTRNVSAGILLAPKTPTPTGTPTQTPTLGPTPTLITGDLDCLSVYAGVTCTNYGTYLDFYINITNATDYTAVGEFTRNTPAAYLGVTTNFIHTVTSTNNRNSICSEVYVYPYDSSFMDPTTYDAYIPDPCIRSSKGTTINFTNNYSYWNWFESYASQPLPQYRPHLLEI